VAFTIHQCVFEDINIVFYGRRSSSSSLGRFIKAAAQFLTTKRILVGHQTVGGGHGHCVREDIFCFCFVRLLLFLSRRLRLLQSGDGELSIDGGERAGPPVSAERCLSSFPPRLSIHSGPSSMKHPCLSRRAGLATSSGATDLVR